MRTFLVASAVCTLLAPRGAYAVCVGDVDNDQQFTANDVDAAIVVVFAPSFAPPALRAAADANQDGKVTAADLVQIFTAIGRTCSQPSPTRTPTPSPAQPTTTFTITPTAPPTPSFTKTIPGSEPSATPSPTPTPTASPNGTIACASRVVNRPTLDGELVSGDCLRSIAGTLKPSDAFLVEVGDNQGVVIKVTNVGDTMWKPVVLLSDPTELFSPILGLPPIQFATNEGGQYSFVVSSAPNSVDLVGKYRVDITTRLCPTPSILRIPGFRSTTIAGDECVDPTSPEQGSLPQGADFYDVDVDTLPTNVSITMRQISADESVSPEIKLISPSGALLVDDVDTIDCASIDEDRECAQIRFMALESGTYRAVASGGGGTGRYTLTLNSPACNPVPLGDLPVSGELSCRRQETPGCDGTWYGDTRKTPCFAPLVSSDQDQPEHGSPADIYSFNGQAGQKVRLQVTSDGFAFVYLFGPATASDPLIGFAEAPVTTDTAELTATLPATGTYTVIAANGIVLDPPDGDEGESQTYNLRVTAIAP